MKKSILTIGLGVLLVSAGFGQTTEKESTSSNSQTATPTNPREVKIKNSVKVTKPETSITIKPNTLRKIEAEAKENGKIEEKTEK